MKQKKILPYFFFSFLVMIFYSQFYFPIPIFPFAPFLALAYSRLSTSQFLWISVAVGGILDLFSHDFAFGLHSISLVSIALLLQYRRLLFVDRPIGFFLLTFLFSLLITLSLRLLLFFTSQSLTLTLYGALFDFLLLPIADAIYGLCFFLLPRALYSYAKKEWVCFLFFLKTRKRKNKEQKKKRFWI